MTVAKTVYDLQEDIVEAYAAGVLSMCECAHTVSRSMQQMSNKTSHFLFAGGCCSCVDPGIHTHTLAA